MQTDEYITRVQRRADLDSTDEASRVTSTVLGIFGTLDLRGQLKDAASQLSQGIGPMLTARETSQSFSASQFVSAVATELSIDEGAAEKAATAVLTTLREALSDGQFLDVNAVLPEEFHRFVTER
ncbi:MAG TPA: DUF2267 domain-containing protein [Brevibacterium senegalense]|uniref:DUF2267 domain-containing protein n=1 Tax=Brevibacterium senegalense TaxID=1033736 RepID=A0A921SP17_9MICO|nr:DUF2267 domain-containing protein [Brevibacterium senegalense]